MAVRLHRYHVALEWTGHDPAVPFRAHRRDYRLTAAGKPSITGSSDAVFRGDAGCWNPEYLLVASLSACHQLWYLALCAAAGLV
jgi:organic hydroperoxide reductase OsmC/OhrA